MLRQQVGTAGPFSDKISLGQLENLTGLGSDALCETQLTLIAERGYPVFRFKNMSIPSYQLRAEEWHCPHCYTETGYINGSWRIAWLPLCTKHQCALVPLEQTSKVEPFHGRDHFLLHSANDGQVPSEIIEVQILLEQRLREEASRTNTQPFHSIITLIDMYLLHVLGLDDIEGLKNRKRRYPLKYFPLDFDDTMKFMECLYVQLIEEKRRSA